MRLPPSSTVDLAVHGLELSGGEMKALGIELDSRLLRTSVKRERYWRLYGALSYLLSRGNANGEMVEVLVGHCTYGALVRRPVLSVFHCVYRFMLAERGKQVELWPSVVEELRVLRGVYAVSRERLVASLESARECQRCVSEWAWRVDRDVDAGGGPTSWADARARPFPSLPRKLVTSSRERSCRPERRRSSMDFGEDRTLCGTGENEGPAEASSGAAKLTTVDDTTPPGEPIIGTTCETGPETTPTART